MEMTAHNHSPVLGGVFKLGEGEEVEVAGESGGDGVTPAPRGSHRTHKHYVHQFTERACEGGHPAINSTAPQIGTHCC